MVLGSAADAMPTTYPIWLPATAAGAAPAVVDAPWLTAADIPSAESLVPPTPGGGRRRFSAVSIR